jgi:hypothetical protein
MAKDPRFDPRLQKSASQSRESDKIEGKEIFNNTINSNHIIDGSITNTKIADSSITTAKIADGQITDAKMTTGVQQRLANTFTKKQIVHRRVLHGAAGSLGGTINVSTFTHSSGYYGGYWTGVSRFMYGPYGYGAPAVQAGAERRTRIYAIWSDNIQNQIGYFEIRITIILSNNAGSYAYTLGNTWGDLTTPRDGYSNELVGLPGGDHGTVYFHVEGYSVGYPPSAGAFWYAELQHLDVFP